MSAYRFPCARAMYLLGVLLLGGVAVQAQIINFVDEFTGPTLDPGWVVQQADNHVGFTSIGTNSLYEMEAPNQPGPDNSAALARSLGSTNDDFTVEVKFQIADTSSSETEYKVRFWDPGFLGEIVVNPKTDTIRAFSSELGQNFGPVTGFALDDGDTVKVRLSYEAARGMVKVGYSKGADPIAPLGSAQLAGFQVSSFDILVTAQGFAPCPPFCSVPRMLLDRVEISDEVVPINFASFEDPFDGPTLDPSWDALQPGEHVGFISGGLYEVRKTSTSGEAGLSRDFGGQADFYSTVELQMQDFIGSDARVEFRHPAPGGGITVVLDSVGDVRVLSEELGTTVADLAGFSYQDGETLKFSVSTDSANFLTEVGLQRNGGPWMLLASLEGLVSFAPTSNETVLIKSGVGNGNSPRLLFDHYFLDEGSSAISLEPFTEYFTGSALDASWFTSDSGTGSLVGFNRMGQYEISPAANVTAGLSRFIGFAGDATFTLTARLVDFMGTDAELHFALTGADALTAILRGDDSVEIISDEYGSEEIIPNLGLSDGDLVTLQFTVAVTPAGTLDGAFEFGLGINEGPDLLVTLSGYSDLNPTKTEITVAGGTGGSPPSILLDQNSVTEGFNLIPQAAETYSDDFNSGPLDDDWIVVDGGDTGTHPGYTNDQWYAMRMIVNNTSIDMNRLMAPNGFAEAPVGSFSATLDVRFDELAGTSTPGGGTDFKYKIEGGNLMEIVFNSFKTVRFYTDQNGQNWFQTTLDEFNDGDTVNFGIVYDASGPSVTMSVGLNGTNVLKETRSNLVGVAPQIIKINGYRFNTSNPDLVPTFLIDQLDIKPGLQGIEPGALTFAPAYEGLYEITWDLGELQSAPDVAGTWDDVMWATSPYLTDLSEDREFFRAEN